MKGYRAAVCNDRKYSQSGRQKKGSAFLLDLIPDITVGRNKPRPVSGSVVIEASPDQGAGKKIGPAALVAVERGEIVHILNLVVSVVEADVMIGKLRAI